MAKDSVAVVVDQNIVDRRSVASILRNEFRINNVYQSGTARDALSFIKGESRIEWVISDTDLPDITGFEFMARAKQYSSAAASSFIMMSSRRDRESLLMAASAGVTDYVIKPFTSSTLVAKLHKLAATSRKRPANVLVPANYGLLVNFESENYDAELLEISLAGCMVRSPLFKGGSGRIYDKAQLLVERDDGPLTLEGVLIKAESDLDHNPNGESLLATFRFLNSDQNRLDQLTRLIASIKSSSQ